MAMKSELEELITENDELKELNLHGINEDGEVATITVSLPDSFKESFKEAQGLKRFSSKRFQGWFVEQLPGFEEAT